MFHLVCLTFKFVSFVCICFVSIRNAMTIEQILKPKLVKLCCLFCTSSKLEPQMYTYDLLSNICWYVIRRLYNERRHFDKITQNVNINTSGLLDMYISRESCHIGLYETGSQCLCCLTRLTSTNLMHLSSFKLIIM